MRRRPLHLGLQLFQLLLHVAGHLRSGLKANVISMTDVAPGNLIDDVGRQLRIRRAVTDQQQKGMQRTGDFQALQFNGRVLEPGGEERIFRQLRRAGVIR